MNENENTTECQHIDNDWEEINGRAVKVCYDCGAHG